MYLSEIFKFTQSLGQNGHQIGRKVGDALEILTLGMISRNLELSKFLEIENGIEGATGAKHKVEFAFYGLEKGKPSLKPDDLFGLIECKKVGVEQTTKSHFKIWNKKNKFKKFYDTTGYSFTMNPQKRDVKYIVSFVSSTTNIGYIEVKIVTFEKNNQIEKTESIKCTNGKDILIIQDENDDIFIISPSSDLNKVKNRISKCVVFQIKEMIDGKIGQIHVNESLAGPQTPEKAKQASFVSLDVRKKVLGKFDKHENKSFISILVIGESSHWEEKSRSMIRLCNDHNLFVPDEIIVDLFTYCKDEFGDDYQDMIKKTSYQSNEKVRKIVKKIIESYDFQLFKDMDSGNFVDFGILKIEGKHSLIVKPLG